MSNPILRTGALGLVAVALTLSPAALLAQTNEKPAAAKTPATGKKEPSGKKQTAGPFRGKLAAVDKTAKTITMGKRTFQITAETKIFKAGKPATLEDAVLGEEVSGGFKTTEDGKLLATKVNFGPKVDAASSGTKKEKKTEKAK